MIDPKLHALILCGLITSCIAGCAEDPPPEPQAVAVTSPVIALTPTEYNLSIRDLLSLPDKGSDWPKLPADIQALIPEAGPRKGIFGSEPTKLDPWPWLFPAEAGLDGFDGMAKGQSASPYLVEELQKAAITYGAYALVSPIFFACDRQKWAADTKDDQQACATASVTRFAQRAFRRPLLPDERTRLLDFWQKNWAQGSSLQAVALTVSGILQAPAFLFQPETGLLDGTGGAVRRLNGWELATRLSYFLWDTMPDGALFEAAAKGQLQTVEQVRAQAQRMLADAKARPAVVRFHQQWLGTDRVLGISPARRVYGPLYGIAPTPPLDTTGDAQWPVILNPARHSLKAETDLFFEQAVFDREGTLASLFTGNTGYVSSVTAPLYGVGTCPSGVGYPGGGPGKGGQPCTFDEKAVDLAPDKARTIAFSLVAAIYYDQSLTLHPATFPADQRAGILTLPSVLAIGAHAVHPSPILRGVTLQKRILCQQIGTPPPTAEAGAPPESEDAAATNRERTETATQSGACSGCHAKINPPGFAFEHYDAFGHWRGKDNGVPVNAAGTLQVPGEPAITFKDAVELSTKLSTSGRVHDCYAQHWVRYATGVAVDRDHPALKDLQGRFRKASDIKALLVDIAASDLFRFRRAGGK